MIEIRIDRQQMDEAAELLRGVKNGLARAASRAVNKVAVAARTELIRHVTSEINIKASDIRERNFGLDKANIRKLFARIRGEGERIALIRFAARQTRRGATYAIRRGGRKILPGGFIAVMDSGHVGVYKRARARVKAARSRKYRARWLGTLPIFEPRGPSIPRVIQDWEQFARGVWDRNTGEKLRKELDVQVGLLLERRPAPGGEE